MTLKIDMSRDQLERFLEAARDLGVKPEELARAVVIDLVEQPREDFERAAEFVLRKNRDLYERLK
jgi:hypothetical protein